MNWDTNCSAWKITCFPSVAYYAETELSNPYHAHMFIHYYLSCWGPTITLIIRASAGNNYKKILIYWNILLILSSVLGLTSFIPHQPVYFVTFTGLVGSRTLSIRPLCSQASAVSLCNFCGCLNRAAVRWRCILACHIAFSVKSHSNYPLTISYITT
jgi:hypothetical protein